MAGGMGLMAYPYFQMRKSLDASMDAAAASGSDSQPDTFNGRVVSRLAGVREAFRSVVPGVGKGDKASLTYGLDKDQSTWDEKDDRMKSHPYHKVHQKIFSAISEDYDETGQIARDEVGLTVLKNIFAQMGIVTYYGVDSFLDAFDVSENDVFCDLGSGTGNIVMQVLHESRCKRAVGVEFIPSRHEHAIAAAKAAHKYFPDDFKDKEAVFLQADLMKPELIQELRDLKVNVILTHSWTFDEELLRSIQNIAIENKDVRVLVTNRPLPDEGKLRAAGIKHGYVASGPTKPQPTGSGMLPLEADWNENNEFHVYTRKIIPQAPAATSA